MNKAEQILDYVTKNPRARTCDVARKLGTTVGYVSEVRAGKGLSRVGDQFLRMVASSAAQTIRRELLLDEQTCIWLAKNCPEDVSLGAFVVAVLRDARMEDIDE